MRKLTILLLTIAFGASFAFAQESEIVGGDEDSLRAFLQQVFNQRYGYEPDRSVTVYIGEVPPELDVEIPLPQDANVVGSVIYAGGYEEGAREIYANVGMAPSGVVTYYEDEANLPEGFYLPEDREMFRRPGGGFQPGFNIEEIPLCYNEGESVLMISARTATESDAQSDVFMRIAPPEQMPPFCDESFDPRQGYGPRLFEQLPELTPPDGVRQRTQGGGGGPELVESAAQLTVNEGVDLAGEAMAAHYNDQFTDAGWQVVDEFAADGGGWSTWTFTDDETDENYIGTFTLVAIPGDAPRYDARISVREADE